MLGFELTITKNSWRVPFPKCKVFSFFLFVFNEESKLDTLTFSSPQKDKKKEIDIVGV